MNAKLIVALDVETEARARELIAALREVAGLFKVGSQLFTRLGPRIVEAIHAAGAQCFLDLKFHDIPNIVAKAVESAGALGVRMVTVHTAGGEEMLRAAAQPFAGKPLLLGVTVLTSTGGDVQAEVVRRAGLAKACGLDGVVASAREIGPLRQAVGPDLVIVTPGIRPAGAEVGDQKRVMTPGAAVRAGADYLVVGRPILAAADPVAAAREILQEMAAAQ